MKQRLNSISNAKCMCFLKWPRNYGPNCIQTYLKQMRQYVNILQQWEFILVNLLWFENKYVVKHDIDTVKILLKRTGLESMVYMLLKECSQQKEKKIKVNIE